MSKGLKFEIIGEMRHNWEDGDSFKGGFFNEYALLISDGYIVQKQIKSICPIIGIVRTNGPNPGMVLFFLGKINANVKAMVRRKTKIVALRRMHLSRKSLPITFLDAIFWKNIRF